MSVARTITGLGHFEPSLTHQLLRGCACGARHPIVTGAADPTKCPDCGAPAAEPTAPITERAFFTGGDWRMRLGRLMLWLGEMLAKLARRI